MRTIHCTCVPTEPKQKLRASQCSIYPTHVIQESRFWPGMRVHAFSPSTWEAEVGGFCVQDQLRVHRVPGLHRLHRISGSLGYMRSCLKKRKAHTMAQQVKALAIEPDRHPSFDPWDSY